MDQNPPSSGPRNHFLVDEPEGPEPTILLPGTRCYLKQRFHDRRTRVPVVVVIESIDKIKPRKIMYNVNLIDVGTFKVCNACLTPLRSAVA